jgi:uncharacterized membrane protein
MPDSPPRSLTDGFRWWALGVAALLAVSIGWYAARYGIDSLPALAGVGLSVFFSKLLIFQGVIGGHPFSPWSLALIAWEFDLLVATLLLLWVARIEHMPVAGPALRRARRRAAVKLEQYPGLRRTAVGGITFFVFLPLPGSGCVTGTLIGQLVGLSRVAGFLAVGIGAAVAVTVYAAVARFLDDQWSELLASPLILVASFVGLVVFAWVAWRRVRRALSKA